MSKINVEVPELAKKLIGQKRNKEQAAMEEKKKADNETVATYAAALGWMTTDDGVVDIEKCKQGIIELAKLYAQISSRSAGIFVEHSSNYRGHINSWQGIGSEESLLSKGYKKGEIETFQQIVEAWGLLGKTFENFNDFVEALYLEYAIEIETENKEKISSWETQRYAAKQSIVRDTSKKIDEAVEARLQAFKLTEEGKGKRKLPKDVEREIVEEAKKGAPEFIEEERPETVEVKVKSKIESGKLSMSELNHAIERLK